MKGYNLKFNRGDYNSIEFYKLICEKFGFIGSFEEFKSLWANLFSLNEEISDYYMDLHKRGITIILASNTDPIHYSYILKRWKLGFLNSAFLSYEHKVIKPDLNFYSSLTKFGNLDPENCIFIDDLEENVKSAKDYGYSVIHHKENYSTIEKIERFLNAVRN
ncbi:MAG: hypothetical protein CR982_06645 [Candidatus Cloacimonadota bacterium]|nr:MAG: hypothetical protein CR982_06645 [Candidatus Cloacimonadota bacterium]PIE77839.1 MAG: hypothetical protein CSA15_11120 [Candidatus Delongbacteria bacterium]